MAAAVQAGAAGRGPEAGQREDAGGQEVQHPEVGPGGLPPRHAAPQQGAGGPQQRHQRQRLNTAAAGSPTLVPDAACRDGAGGWGCGGCGGGWAGVKR